MKKIFFLYFIFSISVFSMVIYYGCSELDKNAVVQPTIGVHPAGWSIPGNANFHGKYIYNNNLWHLTLCKSCHGADFNGGTAGVSCRTCHTTTEGPQDCGTCHGRDDAHPWPPLALNKDSLEMNRGVGVHNHHLTDDPAERYSAQVRCVSCHKKVEEFESPNHHQNSYGRATIYFDSLAINRLPGDTSLPHPVYDSVTNKCSNVYCHGNFKNGNRGFQPTFTDPNSVTCGSCHGDPKTGNPNPGAPNNFVSPHLANFTINTCYQCHGTVIDQTGTIIAQEKHINGIVDP